MPEKKHVCQVDGRKFSTKAALNQHKLASHGAGPMAQVASGNAKRVSRQKKGVKEGAPINTPSTVRGNASDLARMSGTDRVFSQDITPKTPARSKLAEIIIVPGVFKRLSMAARAFQRIRYVNMRFEVETQISTGTSGGYVFAFVRDPADEVEDIDSLTAQRGSVTTKWWQSASVQGDGSNRLLYTSEGKEIREYSPGKLVVFSDGAPTQNGNFTVFCKWSVELSVPSLENPAEVAVVYTTKFPWGASSGHQGFWAIKDGKAFSSKVKDLITPPAAIGSYWKLPYPAVVTQDNGNVRSAHWAYVKDDDTVLPCYTSPAVSDVNVLKVDDLLFPAGTLLDLVKPATVQGEVEAPSSSGSPTTTAVSQELLDLLRSLCANLSMTQGGLPQSSRGSRRSSGASSPVFLQRPEASDSTAKP